MRLPALLLVLSLLITGCSNVRTYTFKRERVDQEMQTGNRGYIHGAPPPAESREGLKRTMIGVDIEIPALPGEEKKVSVPPTEERVQMPPIEEEKTIFEIPEKKAEPKPVKIKGETVEEEEEWIK